MIELGLLGTHELYHKINVFCHKINSPGTLTLLNINFSQFRISVSSTQTAIYY